MPNQIPLDPKLPANFDCTPNESRSKAQLDAWWDRPYAITRDDGKLLVRCLNGGAWDRSTNFGTAENYDEACALAETKQAAWVARRGRPVMTMDEELKLVRMPQRPDQDMVIVKVCETQEQASAYLKEHFPEA